MDNLLAKWPAYLAKNIQKLRLLRGLSQSQLAKVSNIPRSTITHIESGSGNPTLSNLIRVSIALRVNLQELLSRPKSEAILTRNSELRVLSKSRGSVQVFKLLPDDVAGIEIERMEFEPGARFKGAPHLTQTKEYFCCFKGKIRIYVQGKPYDLNEGDVLSFSGDQAHAYENLLIKRMSVGFSSVVLA